MKLHAIVLTALLLAQGCGGGGGGGSEPAPTAEPPPAAAPPAPAPAPAPPGLSKATLDDASRFAARASFGLPYEDIVTLAEQGDAAWIDAQFALPVGDHRSVVDDLLQQLADGDLDQAADPDDLVFLFRRLAWWHRTVIADDVLRQRIAFALSEIFVVSDLVGSLFTDPHALADYYDVLLAHAFGNFRDLLRSVTLHPAMGIYLSHVNNARADPDNNTFPDENYAREVMQLFSIGLFELEIDGRQKLDSDGRPIPTYDNDGIRELAKIFTGLSFGGNLTFFGNPRANFDAPMIMFDEFHEPGEKRLPGGTVVPDGQSGMQDLEQGIDALFNHPNVGPFIGRQLVQRLVTSNPSPAYVERVARAFNGDDTGIRGDMRAVLRAVLLDPEAADAPLDPSTFGKLREPVVRYAALARQFNAGSDDGFFANSGYVLQTLGRQHPLSSPSVFNFFLPTHSPAGEIAAAGLVAPEFEITNNNTVIGMTNLVDLAVTANYLTDAEPPFSPATIDVEDYEAIADDVDALIDRLDTVLTHGALSPATREIIREAVEETDLAAARVRSAIFLFLISPDYAVRL